MNVHILINNPEIVCKEVHKTPKRKESKSSRKKPPTIPTHHTRAVYYSIELRKEMGEMDGLGEKQHTTNTNKSLDM
jgi:hypothetical protein